MIRVSPRHWQLSGAPAHMVPTSPALRGPAQRVRSFADDGFAAAPGGLTFGSQATGTFTLSGIRGLSQTGVRTVEPDLGVSFRPISPKFMTTVAPQLLVPRGEPFGVMMTVRAPDDSLGALLSGETGQTHVIVFPEDLRAIYLGTAETGLAIDGSVGFFGHEALAMLPHIEGSYALALKPHRDGVQLQVNPALLDVKQLNLNVMKLDDAFELDTSAPGREEGIGISIGTKVLEPGEYTIQLGVDDIQATFELMIPTRPYTPKRSKPVAPLIASPATPRKNPNAVEWMRINPEALSPTFLSSITIPCKRGVPRRMTTTAPGRRFSWQPLGDAFALHAMDSGFGCLHMVADKVAASAMQVHRSDGSLLTPHQRGFWRLLPGVYAITGTGGPDITMAFEHLLRRDYAPGTGSRIHNRITLSNYIRRRSAEQPVKMSRALAVSLNARDRIFPIAARSNLHIIAVVSREDGRIVEFGGTSHEWENVIGLNLAYNFATQRLSLLSVPDSFNSLDAFVQGEVQAFDGMDMAIPVAWEQAPDESLSARAAHTWDYWKRWMDAKNYGAQGGPLYYPGLGLER